MHRRPPHILFILAIVFAIAAPAAAHNRVNAIAPQPIELFRETASVDRTPFDEDVLLRSALETVLPPSEPIASLAETRIRDFGDLAPFEREERGELTRALHQSYEQLNEKSASVESFCAGDPINGRDPLGEGILDDIKSECAARAGSSPGPGPDPTPIGDDMAVVIKGETDSYYAWNGVTITGIPGLNWVQAGFDNGLYKNTDPIVYSQAELDELLEQQMER